MLRIVNAAAARRPRRIVLRLGGVFIVLLATAANTALGQPPMMRPLMTPPPVPPTASGGSMIFSDGGEAAAPPAENVPCQYQVSAEPDEAGQEMPGAPPDECGGQQPGDWEPICPPPNYCPWLSKLGFRHSYTHGRSVGWGWPLVGTSWLNRPIYVGADLGPIWMTRGPQSDVRPDADLLGGIFIGYDWDYYWGSEFQYEYATPDLKNPNSPVQNRTHRLVTWNYSLMYYPFGDSALRPYWRFGAGDTHFDIPQADGSRFDEWLFTLPIGIGLQYPIQRWLAARTEFTDNICFGADGVNSQHLLTWTFGLEWRFGFHQESYWPWNPSSHLY
jgi:outer membrane protein with beta-barrel domain